MANTKQPIIKLNSNGEVASCAKGLDSGQCGYTPGSKVCTKCGAMAVQFKKGYDMENDDMMDEEMTEEELMEKEMLSMMKKPSRVVTAMSDDEDDDMDPPMNLKLDEDLDDDELPTDDEMASIEEEDEEEEKMYGMMPKKKYKMSEEMVDEDMVDDESVDLMAMRKKMRKERLASLGYKADDFDADAFICGFERKVFPGGAPVCDSCPGGCVSESGMPSLLEVEGMVENAINGKVLDSGYSEKADTFVLDVERKDGTPVEVFVDGASGEILGWHRLEMDSVQFKQANQGRVIIGFNDAAEIATKSVQGDVVAVEPDIFEGFDAYAVEIEGIDGKSYDVFVDLEGNILGYDEYTHDEANEIEAEAAEIALKRAYSDDEASEMATKGMAMQDGSMPIKDESDLRNALRAYSRAKDKEAAKLHIMKRARALKLEDLIPVNFVDAATRDMFSEEKTALTAEEGTFLSSLMEFEMLAAEHGVEVETDK